MSIWGAARIGHDKNAEWIWGVLDELEAAGLVTLADKGYQGAAISLWTSAIAPPISGSWFATAPGSSPNRSTRPWPGPGRRRYRGREDPASKPQGERLCRTVRTHRPDRGHRPCSSSANDTCGWS